MWGIVYIITLSVYVAAEAITLCDVKTYSLFEGLTSS